MIKASGLAAAYGERIVFENVSFRLGRGRLGLLCGANGAGKSTLVRILAGLARPCRGQVRIRENAAGIAWLGHRPAIYPELTALENLDFWKAAGGAAHAGTEIWLERFGIARFALERAGRLSRGMLQRLALARAFMAEPSILLLDEPTAGLDAGGRKVLLEALARSLGRGACVMLVTHEPEVFAGLGPLVCRLGRHGLSFPVSGDPAPAGPRGGCLCCA